MRIRCVPMFSLTRRGPEAQPLAELDVDSVLHDCLSDIGFSGVTHAPVAESQRHTACDAV